MSASLKDSSLKAYMPPLSRLLGVTPAALYERQRALVRAGLLDAGTGWGPGSGVRTTSGSVALLLISVLASDSLTVAETRAANIANATPVDGDRCPLTGTKSFRDALASILMSQARSARVTSISVSRTAARAEISYREGRTLKVSEFVGPGPDEPGLNVLASLSSGAVKTISADVRAMVHEQFDEQVGVG